MSSAGMTAAVDPRSAILLDFGGVLTTSVTASFRAFGARLGDAGLPLRLLSTDGESRRLISEHEAGRIGADAFEEGFAARLRAHGARGPQAAAEGLQERMMAGVEPDDAMIALVARLRAAGTRVALVSNAFGRGGYAGVDLGAVADEVVISTEAGVRKPSRRIYRIGCERLGIGPERAVLIDDLQQNLDGAARLGIAGILHVTAAETERELAERFGIAAG